MANIHAVAGKILHPEIPYFDHEHLIAGGATAFVIAALLGARELYLARRKRAETEYRLILATTMDVFWITDHEGRFKDVNDAACRHLGYSRKELLGGMRIQDIEAVESPEETAAHIRRIREVGQDRFEARQRRKDGTLVDVEVSVHHTDTGEGRWFTFIRDITERKRAGEALRALHASLEGKVRDRTAEL
jgi:PAS domain S-box-containing protein